MIKKYAKYYFAVLILGVVFLSSLYAYAPYFVVEVKNPLIMTAKELMEDGNRENGLHKKSDFYFTANDGISINVRFSPSSKKKTRGNIILLHGIRSDKNSLSDREKYFNKQGFNTFAMDLRGHGKSGGEYCTYGYKEKEDVKKLVDYLSQKNQPDLPLGIYGHSLGGAVAIQALAIDKRIDFGIIESTYSDFTKITSDYSEYYTGLRFESLHADLLERSGELAGFVYDKVNPKDYCSLISQPVLMVHGAEDEKIKPSYALENYKRLPSLKKDIYIVPKAHHNDIWQIGGNKYHEKILQFISGLSY